MSIPSQLPQFAAAMRGSALQALALRAGQMLDGKVVGPAPNGGTQVQIAGQMLNLVLPMLARAGDTLKFEVQGSGAQLKLALQPVPAQAAIISSPSTASPPVQTQPDRLPPPVSVPAGRPGAALPPQVPTQPAALPLATPASAVPVIPQPAAPAPMPMAPPPALEVSTTVAVSGGPPSVPTSAAPVATTSLPATLGQATPQAAPQPTGSAVATPALPAAQGVPSAPSAPVAPQAGSAMQPLQPYPQASPRMASAPLQPLATPATIAVPARAGASSTPGPLTAPPVPAAQLAVAPAPSTPQAALAQMVQTALPRQDSIVSLTTALTSIAGKVALPEPVVRAAQQLLAARVSIDGGKLDAATLQKAIMRSGVFQEASLAQAGSPLLAPQADMKSSLLALRQTLTNWLGQQAPLTPASQIPPPIRGHVPRARMSDAPPVDPRAMPEEVGKQLLERTEAALSRVRLHQSASLPDPAGKTADWSMDLPVMIGQQQTLLQLQIHRDEHNGVEAVAERGWQMRFAMTLPGMGEVGAQVSLRGGATGIMLWAAERSTSEALEADAAALRETLAAVGLRPGAVIVRHGEPPAPAPAPSGHLVDAST